VLVGAVTADAVEAEVVGQDEDDVGLGGICAIGGDAPEGESEQEELEAKGGHGA
jgi:hypothetical protein